MVGMKDSLWVCACSCVRVHTCIRRCVARGDDGRDVARQLSWREAEARGIPIALATSGLRDHVEDHLRHAGLDDLFNNERNNLVTAADPQVAKGKPAPDIFLEAARRIGVEPSRCRAYEDGESGLQSAYAAGCHVIDVTAMDEYPSCEGLRRAKVAQARDRSWCAAEVAAASPETESSPQ